MGGRREGKNLGFCGNMLKNSYGNLLLLLWNHYKFMLSKNNQVLIPVTQCLLFLLLFNICYYYCVSLYWHYRTLHLPSPPKNLQSIINIFPLLQLGLLNLFFLNPFYPRFFLGGWGEGVLTYFFFFTILDPLQKVHVYMCVFVCVDNIGSFSKVNPSLFTSFLLSSPIIFQLCPSSVVTNDFLIASILF